MEMNGFVYGYYRERLNLGDIFEILLVDFIFFKKKERRWRNLEVFFILKYLMDLINFWVY